MSQRRKFNPSEDIRVVVAVLAALAVWGFFGFAWTMVFGAALLLLDSTFDIITTKRSTSPPPSEPGSVSTTLENFELLTHVAVTAVNWVDQDANVELRFRDPFAESAHMELHNAVRGLKKFWADKGVDTQAAEGRES